MIKKAALTLLAALAFAAGSHAQMLAINEVFPGGGSANTTVAYHEDFIELLNTGTTTIDVTGFTLAYGSSSSAAGTFATAIGTLGNSALSGSSLVAPGQTLLINTGSLGTGGAANPSPDFQFTSGGSLSATSGAIRLANAGGTVLDVVGYGTTNNFETAAATAPSLANSLNRTAGIDTNNNAVDFTSMTPSPMASVPEPGTLAAVSGVVGLMGLVILRRNRTA